MDDYNDRKIDLPDGVNLVNGTMNLKINFDKSCSGGILFTVKWQNAVTINQLSNYQSLETVLQFSKLNRSKIPFISTITYTGRQDF